jgi:hypothetical protein
MTSTIDKLALAKFIELLENDAQSFISFERAVQVMSDVGFSCRLACQSEHWQQTVSFLAPPSNLVPIEADIETPFGTQRVALEPRMSLPHQVQGALNEIRYVVETAERLEAQGDTGQGGELVERARLLEKDLIEGTVRLQRSGTFQWSMDRFQLLISSGVRDELVTVKGPLMAMLSHGTLVDDAKPGVSVRDIAAATVKLLMDRTIERGASIGAGFRAREEGAQLAELLREFLAAIP